MSGARGTTDIIEIPSHFSELYLQDYTFVSQFAQLALPLKPNKSTDEQPEWRLFPIKREVFERMIFCDQIFEWLEMEESIYFTALDVEFHSADKDALTGQDLFDINLKHMAQMTVNQKETASESMPMNPPTEQEIANIIVDSQTINKEESERCFERISEILFESTEPGE